MNNTFNEWIRELNGYLQALERLCGNGYFFGANTYEADKDIDSKLSEILDSLATKEEYAFKGKSEITNKSLISEMEQFIFNGILDRKNMVNDSARSFSTKMIVEDINEYYGLASTSINKEGVFHPLIKGPVFKLNIENVKIKKSLFYVVQIENNFVLTHFYQKLTSET